MRRIIGMLILLLVSAAAYGEDLNMATCGTWEEVMLPWISPSGQATLNRNKRNLVGCFPGSTVLSQASISIEEHPSEASHLEIAPPSEKSEIGNYTPRPSSNIPSPVSFPFLFLGLIGLGFLLKPRG